MREMKLTPFDLRSKAAGTDVKLKGYDWKKQSTEYSGECKAGSAYSTGSFSQYSPEDWQAD